VAFSLTSGERAVSWVHFLVRSVCPVASHSVGDLVHSFPAGSRFCLAGHLGADHRQRHTKDQHDQHDRIGDRAVTFPFARSSAP
jgi:hypothetical protein